MIYFFLIIILTSFLAPALLYVTRIQVADILKLISLISQSFIFAIMLSIYCATDFTQRIFVNLGTYYILNFLIYFDIELDGVSASFCLLTAFILWLCNIWMWLEAIDYSRFHMGCLWAIQLFLYLAFTVRDIILFYVFFEATLMPLFVMIGLWGSQRRRFKASLYFFMFTFVGSGLMLAAILRLSCIAHSSNYDILKTMILCKDDAKFLWPAFFIGLAVKLPIVPLHIWLPEAHVEAPTIGSVILAALLLKLGGYGIFRFLIPIFKTYNLAMVPYVYTLCILSILYASFAALRQLDIKKIIAYSSISHMSFSVIGLFSNSTYGLKGAILLMLGHGLISAGLFFLVGSLQARFRTKHALYYGGLLQRLPLFGHFFFSFTLFNISFPLTVNFTGELLCLQGALTRSYVAVAFLGGSMLLTVCYSIMLFNRIMYGRLRPDLTENAMDLMPIECFIYFTLFIMAITFGVAPELITCKLTTSVDSAIFFDALYPPVCGDLIVETALSHLTMLDTDLGYGYPEEVYEPPNLADFFDSFFDDLS